MVSKERLLSLFASCCGQPPCCIEELPASGSHRRYIRLKSEDGTSLMGVIGTSPEENRAFIALSRHFRSKGLNVPAVLAVSEDGREYLQEDLGETSLFDRVAGGRESGHYSPEEKALLCSAMAQLPRLQFLGGEGLDWSVCFPQPAFDGRTVDFDLNYFKYCFLKATGLEFNE
ncbi:MAG: phosphotransferase, partial [Bacteroidales bacterium]|nr:phosphotransferase [Bacteroidales bacterium]